MKIREESGVSSDRPEELSGKLEEFAEDVKEVLKEELGVSEEDITEAMETLGLTFADLLNPNQLAALVMKLTGESNMGALFCREEFMTILHASESLERIACKGAWHTAGGACTTAFPDQNLQGRSSAGMRP